MRASARASGRRQGSARAGSGRVGEGAGQAVEGLGQGPARPPAISTRPWATSARPRESGEGAGQAVGGPARGRPGGGGLGEAAGQLAGRRRHAGQAVGGLGQAVGGSAAAAERRRQTATATDGGIDPSAISAPKLAKEAVKVAAKQLGSAASDEAKDLSLAATRKVMELGEQRREKRAHKHHATAAALREAEDAGIDIEDVEGSGSDGRITLRDVQKARS